MTPLKEVPHDRFPFLSVTPRLLCGVCLAAVVSGLTACGGSSFNSGGSDSGGSGELVTDGKATANFSQNVEGLTFMQEILKDGSWKFTSDVGAGWAAKPSAKISAR